MTPEEAAIERIEVLRKLGKLTDTLDTIVAIEIAIEALKEIQQYRKIGTVEECREAMEKQIPRKPRDVEYDHSYFICGNCGTAIYTSDEFEAHRYCLNCGQAINWPDMNLEGAEDE